MSTIRPGQPAPRLSFEVYTRGERQPTRVSLAELRGRWVVRFFYPRDFTFVCPTELQVLAQLELAFRAEEAAILAASTDSYYAHQAWFEGDRRLRAVRYPVVADTDHRLSEALGVLLDDGTALRGTFLIDPDGIVRYVQVNALDVGRNVAETLRLLRAYRTGELCPVGWQPGQPTLSELLRAQAA